MRFRPHSYLGLYLALLAPLAASGLHAQTVAPTVDTTVHSPPVPGVLRVLRPVLHADQDQAEFCLEFDHALDVSEAAKSQIALKLDSGNKPSTVNPANINLTPDALCITNLDHRRTYRLTLNSLRGAQDEKLTEPYHLTFVLPDRQPELSFVQPPNADGFMRWQDSDPVLRSLNLAKTRIEIYQVTDTGSLAEAWRQRDQMNLAPSESAYFARHNGQLLWQGDVVIPNPSNQMVEQKIPVGAILESISGPQKSLPRGLYLVLASTPDIKLPTATHNADLAPMAAMWLLRSDLKVQALRSADGYYALTERADATSTLKDVKLSLQDNNRQSLTDGLSDDSGITLLPVPEEKRDQAMTLVGVTNTGDVGFADLAGPDAASGAALPGAHGATQAAETSLTTDKRFYPPSSTIVATLTAQSSLNHTATLGDSHLQMLRPDGSLYASLPVPHNADGIARISFPAPVENGLWSLVWLQDAVAPSDSATKGPLAKVPLRITSSEDAPVLSLKSDQAMLGEDGSVTLSLKSVTSAGKPAPYLPGHITVSWVAANRIFPGWDGYSFGYQDSVPTDTANADAHTVASFITDADGVARLHVKLPEDNGNSGATLAARLNAVTDSFSGALDPAPIIVPAKPKNLIIGIKPSSPDHKFAENSVAHFDVIALDAEGKRRDSDTLTWQIFEVGRSFDWHQVQGRWDYQLQQQQRRVKSGIINLKAKDDTGIDWPVTAGSYRLEVIDAAGSKLAALDFAAGWEKPKHDVDLAPLTLLSPAAALQKGVETQVKFKLDQPAPSGFMLNAVIADTRVRKVIHHYQNPGDTIIRFTPEAGWNNPLSVWIETETPHPGSDPTLAAGHLTLAFGDTAKVETKTVAPVPSLPVTPITITGSIPALLKTGDITTIVITVKNNTGSAGSYHYAFTSPAGLKVAGSLSGNLALAQGQSHPLTLTLTALESGTQDITLTLTGPHNETASHSWTLGVTPLAEAVSQQSLTKEILAPQQTRATPPASDTTTHDTGEISFIGPQPLNDLPLILSSALRSHSFTSREMADELDMLHLWHDVIVAAGFLPDPRIAAREQALRLRVLARQNADGGFPLLPGEAADMTTTAAVLVALSPFTATDQDPTDQLLVQTSVDQASGWLKHRLDNNWFDESERPERAAAYAALALANKLDIASLNYFADTSADKKLAPKPSAQLALAFDKSNDGAKAAYWLNVAHLTPTPAEIDADILPLLAANTAFDERTLLPTLEKLSSSLAHNATGQNSDQGFDQTQAADYLRALWHVENRAGAWRMTIDNGEQSLHNVLVLSRRMHGKLFTLHNPNDRPLYLTSFYPANAQQAGKTTSEDTSLTRRIFRMNGMEVTTGETLRAGETYLVLLEGSSPGAVLLHDNPAPGLRPVSCGIDSGFAMNDTAEWIQSLDLTPITLCEKSGNAVDMILSSDKGAAFHGAYLAKAEWRGSFSLTPASARAVTVNQMPDPKIRIQQSRPQRFRVE